MRGVSGAGRGVVLAAAVTVAVATQQPADKAITELLREDRPYHAVSPALFDQFGWDLPDKGAQVKSLADQAAKSQSISQGTLMEVYEFLLYRNRDVVRDIIESR